MSFTNYLEAHVADEVFGATAFSAPANLFASLHSAYPDESGSGAELSGGNYNRVSITNNTTNWPAYSSDQKKNGTAITFPTASADWLQAVALAIWDASTSGNMLARAWLGSDAGKIFTATAADVVTVPGHSLVVNDMVAVIAVPGATLPTGAAEGTIYFVKTVSGNDITLSATLGGATLDLTAAGAGLIKKVIPKTVLNGETLSFPANSVVITLD
jgi:hypothetical protein